MIHIVLLTGPEAGEIYTSHDVAAQGVTPIEYLADLVRKNWRWQIIWPPKPTQTTEWITKWVAEQLKILREDSGIDLTGRIEISPKVFSYEEVFEWARADFFNRILMAVSQGRAICYQGKRWQLPDVKVDPKKFGKLINEIEVVITAPNNLIKVLVDDGKYDLIIGERPNVDQ